MLIRRITQPPYDPRYQIGYNQELSPELQDRITKLKQKNNLTLEQLGKSLGGLSGSFIGNLMKGRKRIRTKHISMLVQSLDNIESGSPATQSSAGQTAQNTPMTLEEQQLLSTASLEELGERADRLGYQATFTRILTHPGA